MNTNHEDTDNACGKHSKYSPNFRLGFQVLFLLQYIKNEMSFKLNVRK